MLVPHSEEGNQISENSDFVRNFLPQPEYKSPRTSTKEFCLKYSNGSIIACVQLLKQLLFWNILKNYLETTLLCGWSFCRKNSPPLILGFRNSHLPGYIWAVACIFILITLIIVIIIVDIFFKYHRKRMLVRSLSSTSVLKSTRDWQMLYWNTKH